MRFLIEGLTPTILLIVAAVAICIAFWELARWIARGKEKSNASHH